MKYQKIEEVTRIEGPEPPDLAQDVTRNRPACPTCHGEGVITGPGGVTVPCGNPSCQWRSGTPELDKLHAVKDRSQACGEFVDWLSSKGITLAAYHTHSEDCYAKDDDPAGYDYGEQICHMSTDILRHEHRGVESLLAEFFEIDLDKVEDEKRALLEAIRAAAVKEADK